MRQQSNKTLKRNNRHVAKHGIKEKKIEVREYVTVKEIKRNALSYYHELQVDSRVSIISVRAEHGVRC